jgi:hypothetical protein
VPSSQGMIIDPEYKTRALRIVDMEAKEYEEKKKK